MTASAIINKKIGQALAIGTKRANENPEHLKQRIADLEAQIAYLQKLLQEHQIELHPIGESVDSSTGWKQIGEHHYSLNGREAGNQKLLALRLGVGQYAVSKWQRDHRLQTVITPDGCTSFWLDQPKPSRKKKEQKVRKTVH